MRFALLAAIAALALRCVSAQDTPSAPSDTIAPSITVKASSTAAQTAADQFIAGFITTAARFEGPKFISYIATAAKMRPDLASKIVACALNIARLNSHPPGARLSSATVDQIVRAAILAAPESAVDIVKAAIESEPYARESIIAAAIAVVPDQGAEIQAAADQTQSMSMFALVNAGVVNPVNNGGLGDVESPEQPPSGP